MQTFIRVIEVWIPSASGKELELNDGLYGILDGFAKTSKEITFAHGEGLPGSAWKKACPVVLNDFENDTFFRAAEAHKVGLTSAVAIPLFCGEQLQAVITFLCGDTQKLSGAIEVWRDDGLSGLAMIDGYYGDLERFEWLSKQIKFPRGRGLPGKAWEKKQAVILGNLANSNSFLRSQAAEKAGITTSIAIPIISDKLQDDEDIGSIVTFLSSKSTPIAKRFEIWKPDSNDEFLHFESGIFQDSDNLEASNSDLSINKGEGTIGQSWQKGIPMISTSLVSEPFSEKMANEVKDCTSLLAFPVYYKEKVLSIIVFYH